MEPTQLQLVLNVVTITGVTSLAGYCYLLKKENKRLADTRKTDTVSTDTAPAVVHRQSTAPAAAKPDPLPIHGMGPDVRNFAAGRRSEWVKNLTSSIS